MPFATIAPLPTLPPTPGAITRIRCGSFTLEQRVGEKDGVARGAQITIKNAQGQALRTFKANVEYFESIEALYCGDLTGEGTPELVLSTYSGGAHCCFTYDVLSMTPRLPNLLHWEAGNGGLNRLALLKGRPPYEIVGSDDRFAYFADLPVAASPFLPIVFAYRNGRYVNATRDYPQLVKDDQAEARQQLANCAGDEFCEKSFALHVYADGILLNQEAQTLTQLRTQVQRSVATWLNQHRAEILQILAR
jgi:hypothetical protein